MHTRRLVFLQPAAAALLATLVACSTTGEINEAGLYRERGSAAEAGPEADLAPADASVDAAVDAAADAAVDAGIDATADSAADAAADAAGDAVVDAAADTAVDVAADTAPDGVFDAGDLGPVGDVFPALDHAVPDGLFLGDGPVLGCGPATAVGCCRANVLYYCGSGGVLISVDCAAKPKCGWDATYEQYDCGTKGDADPTGTAPLSCPF